MRPGHLQGGDRFLQAKRARSAPPFDQAPDFIIEQVQRKIVIEAKLTEDDGTARDKVTRVQHISGRSATAGTASLPAEVEVVACIAGRGFGVRREDMKKLLLATRGKVFTLQNTAACQGQALGEAAIFARHMVHNVPRLGI